MKQCTKCKETLSLNNFRVLNRKYKEETIYYPSCKKCNNTTAKNHRKSLPDGYIKTLLKVSGFDNLPLSTELIELKRKTVIIKRKLTNYGEN